MRKWKQESVMLILTVDNNGLGPISDSNNLDLTVGKTDIILEDSNLSGLQSDILTSNSTCIIVFG